METNGRAEQNNGDPTGFRIEKWMRPEHRKQVRQKRSGSVQLLRPPDHVDNGYQFERQLWTLELGVISVFRPQQQDSYFCFPLQGYFRLSLPSSFPSLIWPFYPGFLPSSAALTPFFCWEKWNAYRETASPPGRGVSDPNAPCSCTRSTLRYGVYSVLGRQESDPPFSPAPRPTFNGQE